MKGNNMNKELLKEFNEKLEKAKEALDASCEIVPQEETEEPKGRWRARYNDKYWYIIGAGYVHFEKEIAAEWDVIKYKLGNYFKTKQEAEAYRDNLITKQELKDLAFELNGYKDVDWRCACEENYCIIFDYSINDLCLYHTSVNCNLGQIYCSSEDFLDEALNQIGWERLVKLIKSGV